MDKNIIENKNDNAKIRITFAGLVKIVIIGSFALVSFTLIVNFNSNTHSPRYLTHSEGEEIYTKIKMFNTEKVCLLSYSNDNEAYNYALQIEKFLHDSKGIDLVLGTVGFSGLPNLLGVNYNPPSIPRCVGSDLTIVVGSDPDTFKVNLDSKFN